MLKQRLLTPVDDTVVINTVMVPGPGPQRPACIAHGGAWDIPVDEGAGHRQGIRIGLDLGSKALIGGASALEVVRIVVEALEDHPAFDAGLGSVLNRDGKVEMDAGIMCGSTHRFGAVAAIRRLANPVRLAARLLEDGGASGAFLAGREAEAMAVSQGMSLISNDSLIVPREIRRFIRLQELARVHTSHSFLPAASQSAQEPMGTVGCVAIDRNGRLAAATSTGGAPYTAAGRVGDSPIPGSGYYATEHAAVSSTGWGEAILASLPAARAIGAIEGGKDVLTSIRRALEHLNTFVSNRDGVGATGGLILIDKNGRGAIGYTTPRMAAGGWNEATGFWMAT